MLIIIDGYNLLKQVLAHDRISETERLAFIALLGRYSKKRGHKIEVFFDRGPCIHPMKEKYHSITVIFSGEYQTADDLIISFCKEHCTKDILVVTGDREIVQSVSTGNCEVVDPKIFYDRVKSVFEKSLEAQKRQRGFVVKISNESNNDIDSLMVEAAEMGIPIKDEETEYSIPRHHQLKGSEVSKKERKKIKKIDKL